MKGKQVRVVLAALLVVGVVGLVLRFVSSSEDEVVLKGLVPLERDFIDEIVIKSPQSETIVRAQGAGAQKTWFVNATDPVFVPKINQFWEAIAQIDEAGLIAVNTANHQRIGVDEETGTSVEFYLSGAVQEQFIIGNWTPEVRLCYVRRKGQDEVFGIECPVPALSIFDPDPDGWRNPIVASVQRHEIEALVFSHPDQEFALTLTETGWMAVNSEEQIEADPFIVETLVRNVEVIVASGFAEDDEADELVFDAATPSVRIVTVEGSAVPTTRLRFLPRDEGTYYVKAGTRSTVYIIDRRIAELLMVREEDVGLSPGG